MKKSKKIIRLLPWNTSSNKNASKVVKTGIGAAIGGILCGLLIARKPGEDTRRDIVKGTRKAVNAASSLFSSLRQNVIKMCGRDEECCSRLEGENQQVADDNEVQNGDNK